MGDRIESMLLGLGLPSGSRRIPIFPVNFGRIPGLWGGRFCQFVLILAIFSYFRPSDQAAAHLIDFGFGGIALATSHCTSVFWRIVLNADLVFVLPAFKSSAVGHL